MKANEVRVGNIVGYENIQYRIDGISNDYPFLDTIEFGVGVVEWKDLEPIEIYERFLLRNGFEKTFKEHETRFIKNGFVICKFKNENHFIFQGWRSFPVIVRSIHHLQNLYYDLVGSELTIV